MIRRLLLFACALIALSGSLTAAFATIHQRDEQLRGYVDATKMLDLPYRVPRLGVNASLEQYTNEELARHLGRMQNAGVVWVRQFAYWDQIEPTADEYQWQTWDRIVTALRRYPRLRLVAVLMNSPAWARPDSSADNFTAPPDDPAAFADFAGDFATRYANDIDFYQIWDEPNLAAAWGQNDPRPVQYLALLRAAYAALHDADPRAVVMAAALAPTTETGPKNVSDILFLRQLYTLGAQDAFDAAAAKPYGFNAPSVDRTVDPQALNFSRIIALREEMVTAGDGKKALWASSWGWNSLPRDWSGAPSIWGAVNAEQQNAYTLRALERAEREWPWMGGMILFHWQPAAALDDPVWGFALNDTQGEPKPLLDALRQHPTAAAATNGLYPASNPFARYSGVWTFGDLGADIGWINDSQFEFDFTGSDVALLLRRDNYVATLYPVIDGIPANAPPKDNAGNAYILLTSDTLQPELNLVAAARNLPVGPHTLSVKTHDLVPDEAQDRWALAGFAVSSGDLNAPYQRQILATLLSVISTGLAVFVTGWSIPWQRALLPLRRFWQSLGDVGQLLISALASVILLFSMLLTWAGPVPNIFRRDSVQLGLSILTAGLLYLEPGLPLAIMSAFLLLVIFYHRVDLGLLLTLFWAPFFLFPVELYRFAFPVSEILIVLTFLAWLLRQLAGWARARQSQISTIAGPGWGELLTRPKALDWAVAAWAALGILSLTWPAYRPQAITELRVMIVEPALFYLILRSERLNRVTLIRLVDALLTSGVLIALIGFGLYFRGEAVITAEGGVQRLASVYGSPNNVGLFLGRCLPFALAYMLLPLDRRRRALAGAAFLAMLFAVALSQSAGALFIGVPVSIVAVIFLVWGRRAWMTVTALLALGAAGAAAALTSARFARLLDFSSGTNFARIRVWQSALSAIRDHPITGLGLDQFLYAFRGKYILPDAWQEPNLSHPHNFILDFWVRLGIAGVVVFVWIQVAFWVLTWRAYRLHRNSDTVILALAAGSMGSMLNLLSHGLVDNSVFVHDLAYVFVFLLGLAVHFANIGAIDASGNKVV